MVSKISELKKEEFNGKEEKLLKSGSEYPTVECLNGKEENIYYNMHMESRVMAWNMKLEEIKYFSFKLLDIKRNFQHAMRVIELGVHESMRRGHWELND